MIRPLMFAIPIFVGGWLSSLALPPTNFSTFWRPIAVMRQDVVAVHSD